jgi:hypothetical protein
LNLFVQRRIRGREGKMEREQSVPSTAVKRRKRYAKLPKQTPEGKALEDRFVRECATGEALLILFGEVKRGGYV